MRQTDLDATAPATADFWLDGDDVLLPGGWPELPSAYDAAPARRALLLEDVPGNRIVAMLRGDALSDGRADDAAGSAWREQERYDTEGLIPKLDCARSSIRLSQRPEGRLDRTVQVASACASPSACLSVCEGGYGSPCRSP